MLEHLAKKFLKTNVGVLESHVHLETGNISLPKVAKERPVDGFKGVFSSSVNRNIQLGNGSHLFDAI